MNTETYPTSRLPKFLQHGKLKSFLTVTFTGQLVYVSFEAFKGSLMLPLTESLALAFNSSAF
ncbi:MAG: hypothetical protein MR006_02975 [Arcanobacterium sp.]|nr:hypothetical protein [Arcanobacterium sp.]MDY5589627.1 hypothetical protein [Arcanobacterium sp.]